MCSYYANIKLVSSISTQGFAGMPWRIYGICSRLPVVPHFSAGIVKRAIFSLPAACRLFSRGVIFTRARVSHALLSLRKNGGLLVVYICRWRRMITPLERHKTVLSTWIRSPGLDQKTVRDSGNLIGIRAMRFDWYPRTGIRQVW